MSFKKEIAIGLIGMVSLASAQEVVTLGTFGFTKVDKPAGILNLVGNNFGGATSTLNEVAPVDQFNGAIDSAIADRVIVWDSVPDTYNTYALFDGSAYGQPVEWRDSSDFFGSAVNPIIPAGSAFWVQSKGSSVNTNLVISGNVIGAQTVTNQIVTGFQMLSYPFSNSVDLNDIMLKNNATGAIDVALADRVIAWDVVGQSYTAYALFDGTAYSQPLEWRKTSDFFNSASAIPVDLGQGFWYEAQNAFPWVETNKYFNNL